MRRSSIVRVASIVSALTLPAAAARADVLVSNFAEPFRDASPIANPQYWGAQSFNTDANLYQLGSIEAIAGNGANAPQVVAQLRRSDLSGLIDQSAAGLLTTFTAPDLSGPNSARTFLPDSPVVLLPAQTYWFILGSSNAGTYDWAYAQTYLYTGPGTLGLFADSSDAGATWDYRDVSFPYFTQVNVTAVIPEPSSLVLCGLGCVALLSIAARKRRMRKR